jgi:hypothetical protein
VPPDVLDASERMRSIRQVRGRCAIRAPARVTPRSIARPRGPTIVASGRIRSRVRPRSTYDDRAPAPRTSGEGRPHTPSTDRHTRGNRPGPRTIDAGRLARPRSPRWDPRAHRHRIATASQPGRRLDGRSSLHQNTHEEVRECSR